MRQSFAAAKTKVVEENRLARKSGQAGLLFITSFNATALQTKELERLAGVGLKGAQVWGRSKLAALLKDSWLRQEYFHHQVVPGFVPVDHASELDDKSQPDLALVGRTSEKALLREAVEGKPRIGVIWAPGGSGKSRLLRDVAKTIADAQPRRSTWLRRPGQGTIEEALRSGLPAKRPLCLVLDDAGLEPSDVRELARLATSNEGPDVKVIFAIRSVDRDVLLRLLGSWRDAVAWIELAQLSEEDGARVAQLECTDLTAEDAKKLARAFGSNLFLLRAAAQAIRRGDAPGTVVNDDHLRGLVARRIIDDVEANLKGLLDAEGVIPLLAELALNVPLPFDRTGENVALRALCHAKLLRRVGDTLRFRRDVEGDVLLAYLVEQTRYRAVVETLLAVTDDNLLARQVRNLGAAGRGNAATLLAQIVRGWRMSESFPQSIGRLVPLLPHCAQAAPEEVAEFCVAAASLGRFDSDSFGPVVLQLGVANVTRALTLAGALLDLGVPEGRYSNYHRHAIAGRLLSPAFHSPAQLHEACRLLDEWLRAPVVGKRAGLIGAAIDTLVSSVASWDTSDGSSFTMHERALPASQLILDLRRTAVRLLGQMLQHPDREARLQATLVLDRHGAPHLGRVSTTAFDDAAADEFDMLVPIVDVRLSVESDVAVLFGIYEGLATRWAAHRPGADSAARLLMGRPFAPIVRAYHYASVGSEWFYSFDDVLAAVPADVEQRWSWWVHTFLMSRAHRGECERVVDDLCAVYTTVDGVLRCVSALASTKNPAWILDMWCDRMPALFEAALAAAGSAERARLQSTWRRHRYRIRPDCVQEDLQALPIPLALADVSELLGDAALTGPTAIAVGRYLVAQPDVELRRLGLEVVRYRSDTGPDEVLRLLEDALRDGDWSKHWHDIWSVLYSADRQALLPGHLVLRDRIEEVFVAGKNTFTEEWHEQRVLEMLYADDHVRRLALLERLAKQPGYYATNEVGRLLVPLIIDKKQFPAVVDRLVRWITQLGAKGADAVESILEAALHADAQLPEGADEVAIKMLRSDRRDERVVGLLLLAHMPASSAACASIAEVAVDVQDELNELAKKRLWSFSLPQRVWSRAIGEPAPAFLELQKTLREAASRASLAARPLITEVLRYLENHLAAEARRDEEDLDPR